MGKSKWLHFCLNKVMVLSGKTDQKLPYHYPSYPIVIGIAYIVYGATGSILRNDSKNTWQLEGYFTIHLYGLSAIAELADQITLLELDHIFSSKD